MIKHVDYIWDSTSFPRWNANGYINTGIYAVDDIEIRIIYQGAGANVDRIAGFLPSDGCADTNDFRLFYYSNGSLDVKNTRQSNLVNNGFIGNGVDYDITFGNRLVYNNLTQTLIYSASQVTSINQSCTIRVDVNGQKVNYLQIKKDGVVVFDAFAALDDSNNTVGLYDTVSETMFTNSSLNMTYGQIVNTFAIEPETMEFSYSSGSSALTITAENGWTASTNNDWIEISSTAGTGESAITVTIANNATFQDRLGTITVTDGNDTLTCSVNQEKSAKTAFNNKFHKDNTLINKMYLNGALIYQNLFKLIFNIDTTDVEVEYTGGTFTVGITSNRPWSITTPEWVSASSVSGSGDENIIFTVGQNPSSGSSRTGTITIVCNDYSKQISVTQASDIGLHTKLTFEILSDGYINWKCSRNTMIKTIEYSKNGGDWTSITSTTSGIHIDVVTGDKVEFRGNNDRYGGNYYSTFSGSTASFNLIGNIMSMFSPTDYENMKSFSQTWACEGMFQNTNVVSAEKLFLPATSLTSDCYHYMFSNCSNLTIAPILPAETLQNKSYYQMFSGCTNLNYVKCLATNISASNCTKEWMYGVQTNSGTFVTPSTTNWGTGADGIPNNWTRVNSDV